MLNKYETIGVFGSVALMALALFLLRVDTPIVASLPDGEQNKAAITVVANDKESSTEDLYNALASSVDSDGDLQKLVINDVLLGTGGEVEVGDTISVHYIGTLQNGQEFDNSYTHGTPFTFTVGAGRVIEGWDEGLVGMKVGGQRILVIPPDMGYGNQNVGPIPAGSTLIFAVELLEIQ